MFSDPKVKSGFGTWWRSLVGLLLKSVTDQLAVTRLKKIRAGETKQTDEDDGKLGDLTTTLFEHWRIKALVRDPEVRSRRRRRPSYLPPPALSRALMEQLAAGHASGGPDRLGHRPGPDHKHERRDELVGDRQPPVSHTRRLTRLRTGLRNGREPGIAAERPPRSPRRRHAFGLERGSRFGGVRIGNTQRHGAREALGRVACRSLSALTIPLVIALVALLVLSLVLFRGRSRDEPGDAAADIQYRSAKTSGHFTRDASGAGSRGDESSRRRCAGSQAARCGTRHGRG